MPATRAEASASALAQANAAIIRQACFMPGTCRPGAQTRVNTWRQTAANSQLRTPSADETDGKDESAPATKHRLGCMAWCGVVWCGVARNATVYSGRTQQLRDAALPYGVCPRLALALAMMAASKAALLAGCAASSAGKAASAVPAATASAGLMATPSSRLSQASPVSGVS